MELETPLIFVIASHLPLVPLQSTPPTLLAVSLTTLLDSSRAKERCIEVEVAHRQARPRASRQASSHSYLPNIHTLAQPFALASYPTYVANALV